MLDTIKDNLWSQFGGSIDMLRNAIERWPDERWNTDTKFFYMAYHVLIFLEYYLTFPAPKKFEPLLPFTEVDEDKIPSGAFDDLVPNRIYSKQELLDYLNSSRKKCRQLIAGLTEESIRKERWIKEEGSRNYAMVEMLIYNMRHVQHHAAQLNTMLRKEINDAPRWVRRAPDPL